MRVKPTKLYLIVYKFNAYMLHAFSYFCEEKKNFDMSSGMTFWNPTSSLLFKVKMYYYSY